jgi:hypothetical protein
LNARSSCICASTIQKKIDIDYNGSGHSHGRFNAVLALLCVCGLRLHSFKPRIVSHIRTMHMPPFGNMKNDAISLNLDFSTHAQVQPLGGIQ